MASKPPCGSWRFSQSLIPTTWTIQPTRHVASQDDSTAESCHLPISPTPLIGRAPEVEQLGKRLLGHYGRLLTLVGTLQVALLDSFTLDTMRQMTRIYLDVALEEIAGGSDFSGITFNRIAWAERSGRLPELLDAAQAAVPNNARLKECAALLRPYLA